MTSVKIRTAESGDSGSMALPGQFKEAVRPDLIARAVLALQAARRQPYGGYGQAGMRHSDELSKRRKDYRGSYGKGQSRVPRKIHTRRGRQMYMVGSGVPGMVGGRRAHPPKPMRDWTQKVNKTENRKAIRSALSATMQVELVSERGHHVPKEFPFILDSAFEKIAKTAELEKALVSLGFADELARGSKSSIRAGKGKLRGRRLKRPTSFLFVVGSADAPLARAAANIPGADVASADALNAEILAPGTHPGRLTLYTQDAITRLDKEGLFTKSYKGAAASQKPAETVKAKKAPKKSPARKKPAKQAKKSGSKSAKPKASAKAAKKPAAKTARKTPKKEGQQ